MHIQCTLGLCCRQLVPWLEVAAAAAGAVGTKCVSRGRSTHSAAPQHAESILADIIAVTVRIEEAVKRNTPTVYLFILQIEIILAAISL